MNNSSSRKRVVICKLSTVAVISMIICALAINNTLSVWGYSESTKDSSVENSSSFSTDVIYQSVTDRFLDGNPGNNPQGDAFDVNNMRKYHGGDWAGIVEKLNDGYFTKMGITALWISSPVENITTIDPSNNTASYHGYWGRDFFRTNEAFGTMKDFQKMIDVAHEKDIKIVIDFVPNHTSTAELGNTIFPEDGRLYRDGKLVSGFKTDSKNIFNHESWTDFSTYENGIYHSMYGLADLNQLNPAIDSYLKESIDQWLDLGVDGIRVDAVKHMPEGWQKSWLSNIYGEHQTFIFGEWFTGSTDSDKQMEDFANKSGMSLLDFRFANAVRNTIGEKNMTMKQLYNVMDSRSSDFEEVNDQVTFIDNHDMERFMSLSENDSKAVDLAYVLLLTSNGIPTIYYGSEQYLQGESDPDNRADMPSFTTDSNAYKIIGSLAPLRKTNPALAYGTLEERWLNNDVMIFEREFAGSVVLTAVNRSQRDYDIQNLVTSLPYGEYQDVLTGIMGGESITVSKEGKVKPFKVKAGESAVWEYTKADIENPRIGNVDPMMGICGNDVTITGRGFGEKTGIVYFGEITANVQAWSDSKITVNVPNLNAGKYNLKVVSANNKESNMYKNFEVLSGKQTTVRFIVNNAETFYGSNVYLVGNVYELGNWDTSKAIGPLFNSTSTIGVYPTWFYDVNVPAGRNIEYKFVKIDTDGKVNWEGGENHKFKVPDDETAEIIVNWK